VIAAAALALPTVALSLLAAVHETFPLDTAIMPRVQALGSAYEPVAEVFNEYNGYIALAAVVLGAALMLVRRRPDAALLFILAAALRPLLNEFKALVDRPRPTGDFPILDTVNDSSFPSGHVMTAAMFLGLWFILAAEVLPRPLVLPARVFVAVLIALTAFSRIWAGVHWPSDTYGAVLWTALALAVVMAFRPTIRVLSSHAVGALRG
jgi:undecaprenyl-diphosphatase